MVGSTVPGAGDQVGVRTPSTTEGPQPATERPTDDVAERRRGAVSAGHRGDRARAVALLDDPEPAVRCAALGALSRAGGLTPGLVGRAMADADGGVRRRACEEAGRMLARRPPGRADGTGGRVGVVVELVALLMTRLEDADPAVTEAAAWASGEAGRHAEGAVPVLAGLARSGPPPCREAAVAALGAIGHPDGLAAVLEALGDRPAVRRRAAVALAAFDDPRADEGLRRAAADRDWQVRQVAEDLLGDG